jgi:hypothetical protein
VVLAVAVVLLDRMVATLVRQAQVVEAGMLVCKVKVQMELVEPQDLVVEYQVAQVEMDQQQELLLVAVATGRTFPILDVAPFIMQVEMVWLAVFVSFGLEIHAHSHQQTQVTCNGTVYSYH